MIGRDDPGAADGDVEALVADRYLEALLTAGDRLAIDAPGDPAVRPELRDAARILRGALVRIHPSFRFEERLAARLAELAADQARPTTGGDGVVVPFARVGAGPGAVAESDAVGGSARTADPMAGARRPLLVGGALTSAAISIVGVAWVAWRATRPAAGGPSAAVMARAVRAAHLRRTPVGLAGGRVGGPS